MIPPDASPRTDVAIKDLASQVPISSALKQNATVPPLPTVYFQNREFSRALHSASLKMTDRRLELLRQINSEKEEVIHLRESALNHNYNILRTIQKCLRDIEKMHDEQSSSRDGKLSNRALHI